MQKIQYIRPWRPPDRDVKNNVTHQFTNNHHDEEEEEKEEKENKT